jgi:adenine phosphoribosyltransferase
MIVLCSGTMGAAVNLFKKCGAEVVECLVVMELADLKGREKLDVPTWALVSVRD